MESSRPTDYCVLGLGFKVLGLGLEVLHGVLDFELEHKTMIESGIYLSSGCDIFVVDIAPHANSG